jgi:hypothetical protein
MKYSTITPTFKKGNKSDPANYRPISVSTSFAKVLERALYMRLTEYFTSNNILTDQQHGFRKGYSTDVPIFKLINEVLKVLNDKSLVGGIFFDLEKAFNSVNHSLLIKKLPSYGIVGEAKLLIESYLSNRYQRVFLKKSRTNPTIVSGWAKVNHGVPQGLVLGPMPKAVPSKIIPILYENDTSIIITCTNTCELQKAVSTSIHQLTKWFQEDSSLNISKTYFLQFHTKN